MIDLLRKALWELLIRGCCIDRLNRQRLTGRRNHFENFIGPICTARSSRILHNFWRTLVGITQKVAFTPNSTCRAPPVPLIGLPSFACPEERPNRGGTFTIPARTTAGRGPRAKLWLLRTLKADRLNSSPSRSRTLKLLRRDRSHSWNGGPSSAPVLMLPNVP